MDGGPLQGAGSTSAAAPRPLAPKPTRAAPARRPERERLAQPRELRKTFINFRWAAGKAGEEAEAKRRRRRAAVAREGRPSPAQPSPALPSRRHCCGERRAEGRGRGKTPFASREAAPAQGGGFPPKSAAERSRLRAAGRLGKWSRGAAAATDEEAAAAKCRCPERHRPAGGLAAVPAAAAAAPCCERCTGPAAAPPRLQDASPR